MDALHFCEVCKLAVGECPRRDCPAFIGIEGMDARELRAYEYANAEFINALDRVLVGKDRGTGQSHEPWQSMRRYILHLKDCQRELQALYTAINQFQGKPNTDAVEVLKAVMECLSEQVTMQTIMKAMRV